jgi:hypothetical protein
VVPEVVGSIPITHPIYIPLHKIFFESRLFKKEFLFLKLKFDLFISEKYIAMGFFYIEYILARVAELVDALDLESSDLGREGSSPSSRTFLFRGRK